MPLFVGIYGVIGANYAEFYFFEQTKSGTAVPLRSMPYSPQLVEPFCVFGEPVYYGTLHFRSFGVGAIPFDHGICDARICRRPVICVHGFEYRNKYEKQQYNR